MNAEFPQGSQHRSKRCCIHLHLASITLLLLLLLLRLSPVVLTKACLLFHQSSKLLGSCCFPSGLLLIAQAAGIPWPRNEVLEDICSDSFCQELFLFLDKALALSNSIAIIYVGPQLDGLMGSIN